MSDSALARTSGEMLAIVTSLHTLALNVGGDYVDVATAHEEAQRLTAGLKRITDDIGILRALDEAVRLASRLGWDVDAEDIARSKRAPLAEME